MTAATTLRQALRENLDEPEGPARNARAERIFADIEAAGDTGLLIDGLNHLMQVYNYSSEADKMFVPFARLLRMWDERPDAFDQHQSHTLFWMFKWVSSGMIDQPHIPLASIETWQAEMERRYRVAGHSERAVRQGELRIARHLGDDERARRAYDAWQRADRDDKSDCRACELHAQGEWQAHNGDDKGALETWRPVLEGQFTCAHEPHAVLASSLLPLMRLGRTEEARAHHLRGHRLVRAHESMRESLAEHIEFCARTGNEGRGLELLAERPAYFTDPGEPSSLMGYLAVTALLADRLVTLGLGETDMPGPGERAWTARELATHARREALAIAARFDERNGSAEVSALLRERMDGAPLVERLPLGLRATTPRPTAPRPTIAAPPLAQTPGTSLEELLTEARHRSEAHRPDAGDAWRAVVAAARHEGVELDPLDLAEIDEYRGLDREPPAESADCFASAAAHYGAAGAEDRAVAARARAAYARCLAGDRAAALADVESALDRIERLRTEGAARPREISRVLVCRARIHEDRLQGAEQAGDEAEGGAALEALEEAARGLVEFAEPHRADPSVALNLAEALAFLGLVARYQGDVEAAADLYERSAETSVAAGRPWAAVSSEVSLSALSRQLGDTERAVRAARAALEHTSGYGRPPGLSRLHLQLMECLTDAANAKDAKDTDSTEGPRSPADTGGSADTTGLAEATEHALQAAHWADEAGESTGIGAYARHRLGGLLLRRDRVDEAASVLEAVLPDLTADEHGDGMIVQTLHWLGDCLITLGDPRGAAEQYLKGADIARTWPEQRGHAMLANLAAESLFQADLNTEAELAYRRAGELWRSVGDPHGWVRTLRVRAWIALRDGQAGPDAARELMAEAAAVCTAELAALEAPSVQTAQGSGRTDGTEAARALRAELGETHRQTAEVLVNTVPGVPGDEDSSGAARAAYETAQGPAALAVDIFAALGDGYERERARCLLLAGWLAADLGDADAAVARAREAVIHAEAAGDAEDLLHEAASLVANADS
ncbi:tetratricopeptide repeat protein [Streptomyces sp. NPDC057638]|uniref:tetratricopeptide repeat protein n=1 Tax=Streptomyces sp. NPDC057638 TaxID=3346190 RepID=UPI0036C968CE